MLGPRFENKVMHSEFKIGDATLYACDRRCRGNPTFEGFSPRRARRRRAKRVYA
jgi:uncharacterized glyoxalase superfamily protein PhnB